MTKRRIQTQKTEKQRLFSAKCETNDTKTAFFVLRYTFFQEIIKKCLKFRKNCDMIV